jgi:asparagine synthase (glutamine-hydrolysing)
LKEVTNLALMCGISGFFDFKGVSTPVILDAMTDVLEHRGPDGRGVYYDQNNYGVLGLGHRRLSIIDLSETGKQPMQFAELCITFNGEIYNYQDIKKELSAKGHQFIGNSDTEVILHAFKEWGISSIDKLKGMFSFVIYDKEQHKITAVRDRVGVKPLFYYLHDGLFMFSSELKSFHQHPKFNKTINKNAVADFIQYGNIPGSQSIFQFCNKLQPGHYLELNLTNGDVLENKYWNVYDAFNKPKLKIDFEEAKTITKDKLKDAFELRMVADVPVGVFLSGGYDSTCVTGLLQQNRSEKLKTYTIGVPDIGLNEAPFAKEIAEHFETEHTELNCTVKDALDLINDLPFFYDEPFADSSAIPTILVSKMARKHVTVALSADGGDELFAGYNRYDYMLKYGQKLEKIPKIFRKSLAGAMSIIPANQLPILKKRYNFHQRYEKVKKLLKEFDNEAIMMSLSQQFTSEQMREILKFSNHDNRDLAFFSKELKPEYLTPLSYMLAIDFQTYLVDDIMQKVDRASMAVSLEGREPFLDHDLINWAAQLPDDFKYKSGIKKYILKEIVHEMVPKEMMERPKMGFAIPIADWLAKDLKPIVEIYLSKELLNHHQLFDTDFIEKLKTDVFNGKKEMASKLWYFLMFQMWYERWMK